MIYVILGLSLISGGAIFGIVKMFKKNKSLNFKLDFAEREMAQMRKNRIIFETTITKLEEEKAINEENKQKINIAVGSTLSDELNKL